MNPNIKAHAATLVLAIAGAAMIYWFQAIADASFAFEQGTFKTNRPIIAVLTWFWLAFAAYLVAWAAVGGFSRLRRQPGHKSNWVHLVIIFAFAIAFRYVMTPTVPIQEIDLYRYIWDGAVVSNQLDPYQFGPQTVYQAIDQEPLASQRKGLDQYTAIVKQRPGLKRVLEITHFGKYTSPYPPVSQAVFGLAVSTVKPDADARQYVITMKTALVIFDLLTGIVIALLLYHVGMNPSLSLGYLWCPLVLKEIANGGHLDSIATFFAVLAVYLTTRALWKRPIIVDETAVDEAAAEPVDDSELPPMSILTSAASALALAAAFSAKVFPIVLAPIWFVILARRSGVRSVFSMTLFLVAAYAMSLPMLNHLKLAQDLRIVPTPSTEASEAADLSGIEAFSKYWEMNDFLFMLAVENIKPAKSNEIDKTSTPWFAVTNNDFRSQVITRTRGFFEDEDDPNRVLHQPSHFAFFTTRALSLAIFLSIGLWACFLLLFRPSRVNWLEMAFLATAWFWLLSPTQNPWYWTWSMPLLVFSRGRIWIFLSGTLLAYYLRFWLEYHFTGIDVMGYWKTEYGDSFMQNWFFPYADQFAYQGTRFFDLYVPVLEFGPWFFLLFVGTAVGLLTRRGTK